MFPFSTSYAFQNLPLYFHYNNHHQPLYPQVFPIFQNATFNHSDQFYFNNCKTTVETQDEPQRFANFSQKPQKQCKKKKKIIKKLTRPSLQKPKEQFTKTIKPKNNSFKYFDPSLAPPITSLRNKIQLFTGKDKILEEKKQECQTIKHSNNMLHRKVKKLQILLKQPDPKQFPFIICKKRRYYRNMKRRYSVAYFTQRSYYIQNQIPIPEYLEPKNKHRKSQHSEEAESSNQVSSQSSQNLNHQQIQLNNAVRLESYQNSILRNANRNVDVVKAEVKEEAAIFY